MAIDIKQLRIGSHVFVSNKRRRVTGLKANAIYYLSSVDSSVYQVAGVNDIAPIPIFPEILCEMGFKHNKFSWGKRIRVPFQSFFFELTLRGYGGWRINVSNFDGIVICQLDIQFLHELENIVYLVAHTELLQD